MDFATGSSGLKFTNTALHLYGHNPVSGSMNFPLPADSGQPMFLVLKTAFYQEVGGVAYQLKNGVFNAISLVQVSV